MTRSYPVLILILVLALALAGSALAGPEARATVQGFYKAYQANGERLEPFTKQQKDVFEPDLADMLLDVMDNQPGTDEVWMDFDPFINGQMNAATISVGQATMKGGLAYVPVAVSYRSPGHEVPAVTVVLREGSDGWKIANFEYPARDGMPAWDLKGWLKEQLKK